jgi:N-acetylglucosaminyldiphosphoundecaprenol N-acetyl-beta-D-mannosaminyltransferase
MHYRSLGVPVSVGVGGTIDFLAGTTKRAPRWMQRAGIEWTYRLAQEPRRLFKRYATDLFWFSIGLTQQWFEMRSHSPGPIAARTETATPNQQDWQRIRIPRRLDLETVRRDTLMCEEALARSRYCLLELGNVSFIDSTGIGLLIRLQKKARITGGKLVLLAPSQPVRNALKLMRLEDFFMIARDLDEAQRLMEGSPTTTVSAQPNYFPSKPGLFWRGEVTAANADEVWKSTSTYICSNAKPNGELKIDLSSLNFIDSTGVGLMIRAKRSASANGMKLHFIGTQANVRNVLRTAKLESSLLGAAA